MEDLDSILQHNIESDVINILDGVDLIDKVVFIATTNYPELLGERVINRPSRFDRRFYIGPPNEASRLLFFKFLFQQGMQKPEDRSLIDLMRWVKDTEGMSIAHLKELFVACVILGTPYEEALKTLKSMEVLPDSKEYHGRRLRRMNIGTVDEMPAGAYGEDSKFPLTGSPAFYKNE